MILIKPPLKEANKIWNGLGTAIKFPGKYGLEVCDATKVADLIEKSKRKIAAIVTEGTLGPIYGKYPKPDEIKAKF